MKITNLKVEKLSFEQLIAILDEISDNINVYIPNLLNNIDEYFKLPEGDTRNNKLIKTCDFDYTIELRFKKGQLHIHIMFKFRHFTKVQLINDKIKNIKENIFLI